MKPNKCRVQIDHKDEHSVDRNSTREKKVLLAQKIEIQVGKIMSLGIRNNFFLQESDRNQCVSLDSPSFCVSLSRNNKSFRGKLF